MCMAVPSRIIAIDRGMATVEAFGTVRTTSLMLLGGTTNTIIQMVAAEDFRGRVISHYTQSFMGMMPWGALLLGTLAARLGVTNAISIGGLIVLASAIFAFAYRRATGFTIQHAPAQ